MAGKGIQLLVASVVLLAASCPALGIQTIAGTDSFNDFATALIKSFGKVPDTYQNVGSESGIKSFNSAGATIAVSDLPMSPDQEDVPGTVSKAFGRLTLPLVMGTYGFFVNAPAGSNIQLTALQTWLMYSKGGLWQRYGAPITGPIVRFARGDSCGANLVMKRYWQVGAKAAVNMDDGPLIYDQVVYVTGAQAMCQGLTTKPGGIAYSLTGICMPLVQAGKIVEVAMQQGNGRFMKPSMSRPALAIPKVLPPTWMPWTDVFNQLMFSKNRFAPPIVVFQYAFIRRRGLKAAGPQGAMARQFMLYAVQQAPILARQFGYLAVPASVQAKNLVAVHSIKLV